MPLYRSPQYWQNLLEFAWTDNQKTVLKAMVKHGNAKDAAKSLGCSYTKVNKINSIVGIKAAAKQNPDSGHRSPPGFSIDKVSDMYNHETGEITRSWYIQKRDGEAGKFEQIKEACIESFADIKPVKRIKAPTRTDKQLMNCIPLGDPHIGMYAFAAECGKNFDCDIAEAELLGAIQYLVDKLPPAETCLIINLGDFFHSDGDHNRTKSGNHLDVDGRWSRVLRIGISLMISAVNMALVKHKKVIVKNIKGNHDSMTSQVLSVAMEFAFKNNPRVDILPAENPFMFHQFGKVMIASTHGDLVKPAKGPEVAANYAGEMWGNTLYRYFLFGHFHHEHRQEIGGMTVEVFNTMASQDAWHYASGYKSQQNLKGLTFDCDYGEVERCTFDVRRLSC